MIASMKTKCTATFAFLLCGVWQSNAQCNTNVKLLDVPLVQSLEDDIQFISFHGVTPKVVRVETTEPPFLKVTGYSNQMPVMMMDSTDSRVGRVLQVMNPACAPEGDDLTPPTAPASNSLGRVVGTSLSLSVASLLGGASLEFSSLVSVAAAAMAMFPTTAAQDDLTSCENILEIEIHGPAVVASATEDTVAALEDQIIALQNRIAELENMTATMFTQEEVETTVVEQLIEEYSLDDFAMAALPVDQTVARISNNGAAAKFDSAGFPIFNKFNPEAQYFLSNAGDDSLVRDMQGEGFQFPTTSNLPEEVMFDLPEPPAITDLADLIFMPIMEIAALIENRSVSCVDVVQTFVDRLDEFDPYLGIVSLPLYETALETAASHDALLASGTYVGPLMCIPFGLKDHHQIGDTDYTRYGHLLHATNIQTVKSTLIQKLMEAGAIPIAKMMLGTYAWSSANGWGECMSPYLNGPGGGSSCGSGSGAALGALPFAVSEETSGSIASPAAANVISGHIGSYGTISRAGAGLLCSETDHLGFHSRYLSDFGLIFNYMRTGADPLDGDSLDIPYVNPADVDLSELNVLIIEGEGLWVYDNETDSYSWDGGIRQYSGKSGWQWPLRVERIKSRLDAAGVSYDAMNLDMANGLWSFNSTTPFFDCANPQIDVMMAGGPWSQLQECEYCFQNAKWKTYVPRNVPAKSYRYLQFCMKEMGKHFLNDKVWDTYDVIIETNSATGGGYDAPGGSFEQWVRTSKTFVIDYMEELPCTTQQGDTIEGAFTVLTAKPFEDYKNFAVGSIIQDTSNLLFPKDDAIKTAFAGRTRCPYAFYEKYNDLSETCPSLNTPGGPPSPSLRGIDSACTPGSPRNHLPEEWANEPYTAPYKMDELVPDRALWRWDEYGPVACTAVCPFVPAFCELKGIVCDARRLEEEAKLPVPVSHHRKLSAREYRELREQVEAEMEFDGEF